MAPLSSKSDDEISQLLNEYGIKHGPVVDSTRRLYEKKILEAMATGTKGKPSTSSADKTYYREEEEEITYVYKLPVKREASGDRSAYLRSRPEPPERDSEEEKAEEETTSSTSYQPSHYRYSPYCRGKDKFHRPAFLRPRPEPPERDSEEKKKEEEEETTSSTSYQPTQPRYKPDYREKDKFQIPAYLRPRPRPSKRDSEEEKDEEEEEETASSTSHQPSHYRHSPYYREKDKLHRSAYLRPRPGPSERDSEEEETTSSTSYQPTQPRSKPDDKEKDESDSSYIYDILSSFRCSCTPPPLMKSGQDAAKPNTSSGRVPEWVQLVVVFLILAFVLYLMIYKMQKNEFLKKIS